MQNLFRRPSGIYFLRLVVPAHLREVFGRREIVATTGTTELAIAKMVGGSMAAQWRERFFESGRLLALAHTNKMAHQEILRIAQGHPILLAGGHLRLAQAANASGLSIMDLLRAASKGTLRLFIRVPRVHGFLLSEDDLELDVPAMGREGGFVIPSERQMPEQALEHVASGVMRIPTLSAPGITADLMSGADQVEPLMFEVLDQPALVFIPNTSVPVRQDTLEVAAHEVEALRRHLAELIEPEQLATARAQDAAAHQAAPAQPSRDVDMRLSVALDNYVTSILRRDLLKEGEIKRIRNGCALLIELEGDMLLTEIDSAVDFHPNLTPSFRPILTPPIAV